MRYLPIRSAPGDSASRFYANTLKVGIYVNPSLSLPVYLRGRWERELELETNRELKREWELKKQRGLFHVVGKLLPLSARCVLI